ncbi:MAG: hypothetical protein JWO38_2903 [Gemmataceae bacterium]|nr:hypothetical protein [Gemmataceae bacterium]
MTAHDTPDLPGPWPDVLAAYADGELDPAARAVVGRCLAAHPATRDELRTQQLLSPENWTLWQQAEPTLPSEAVWAAVREAVAEGALPLPVTMAGPSVVPAPHERGWWRRTRGPLARGLAVAVAGVAVLAALWFVTDRVTPPPVTPGHVVPPVSTDAVNGRPTDPLAGLAALPLATAGDVDIQRVAGSGAGWLPVGEPPLSGPLVLAGADDVELEGVDPNPAWPAGGPRMTSAPGDAPMIFAAKPR